MVGLTQQERLQPSLLDRLTDEDPGNKQESRDRRVLSFRKLRECVKRDLAWLLNTGNLDDVQDLSDYPFVLQSVLNYGLPDLTGITVSNADLVSIERRLCQAILDFEPRILRDSLNVRVLSSDEMNHNAMMFEIECDLWAQPVPERMFLKTEIDLESGSVTVADNTGRN